MKHFDIKTHNTNLTLTDMERLTREGFGVVIPEHWRSLIDHVKKKVEDQ